MVSKAALVVLASVVVAIVAIFLQQPSLGDYPDLGKTIPELIASRGFQAETHEIKTADGYFLTVHRIVNPHVKNRVALKPILLHHGFQCSGSLWLVASNGTLRADGKYVEDMKNPEATGNSLGFVLAAKGYDVWLANYRGNIYSRKHVSLKPEDDKFWRFSIDDMIKYDLPAEIEYIRTKTGKKTVSYIGHSQGNFMMFALLASQPQYSNIIKPHIALSPVSFLANMEAIIMWPKPIRSLLLKIHPRDYGTNLFKQLRLPTLCTNPMLQKNLCYYIYWLVFGAPTSQLDWSRLPIYFDSVLTGSSSRNYYHFLQHNVVPSYYNYDEEEPGRNEREYGQSHPPTYKYRHINSSDIALMYTKRDWFNHLIDIHLLKENLDVKLLDDFVVPDPTWNHMELVWAKDVGKVVNSRILKLLEKY